MCEDLSKIYCDDFDRRRKYAIRDILLGLPRHDRLRGGERFALRDFSVTVRAGENVAVLALPGAGKTTIARLLTRVLRPDGGSVRANGRVGLVFGGKLGMTPFLTVGEFTQLAVSIHGAEPDSQDACCDAALEMTGLADHRDTGIVDIQDSGLGYLSLAASLVVPQELRIFDGVPRVGDDPVGTRIAACVRQHFEQGGNLILTATAAGLPANLSHALIVHDGETLYEGRPEMALQIYERFAYRMERMRVVEERREEAADATPASEDLDETEDVDENEDEVPSAAALMKHHAVKVDRSWSPRWRKTRWPRPGAATSRSSWVPTSRASRSSCSTGGRSSPGCAPGSGRGPPPWWPYRAAGSMPGTPVWPTGTSMCATCCRSRRT